MHYFETIGGRLTPDQLLGYRETHVFHAPCCLCESLDDHGYTETTIVVKNSGEFVREYVAECMLNVCGYLGMSEFFLTSWLI